MLVKRRRWNAGRQHSWRAVPWKRSHTALWFGDAGRDAVVGEAEVGEVGPEPVAVYSGPLSVSTARTGPAQAPEAALDVVDEAAGVLGGDGAEDDLDDRPAGGGVDGGELVHLADAFEVADVEAVDGDQVAGAGG